MSLATEIGGMGAAHLARLYRAGELSPSEVVAASIEVAESTGRKLNALAADAFERAAEEARKADAVFAGDARSSQEPRPLEGIPLLAKDLFDSEGIETAYGSPIFAGHVPDRDAEALRLARRAGVILIAKTSTDEFAYGITSHNPHLGPVRNPWAPDRVSGGSSGGSAAAVAAGAAPLALGSDTGGSIRVPAAFCGIVGFKPSFGAVSNAGLFPMARSLDHTGPMARTPEDARLLFDAIADPVAPAARRAPAVVERVAVSPDLQIAPPSPAVAAAFAAAVEAVRELGVEVVERAFGEAADVFPTFLTIQRVETSYTHRRRGLYPERRGDYGPDVRERLDVAARVGLDEYLDAGEERARLQRRFAALFEGDALLLAPVQSDSPPPISTPDVEETARRIVMDQTVPQNLFGLPACTIRAGFDEHGIPVGVQIVGPPWADRAVLDLAGRLWAATPEVQAPVPPAEGDGR